MSKEQLRQWAIASFSGLTIFSLFSLYLFFKKGQYNLYLANKAAAEAALALLGLVLLIGVLSRLYRRFDSWVAYRKELGIVCFFLALIHFFLSFFFLPHKFNLFYFRKNWLTFSLGLIGLLLLTYLFVISFEFLIAKLGRKRWWQHQVWGARLAGLFAFSHFFLKEYHEWIEWFNLKEKVLNQPSLPPLSLLVGGFGIFVILTRLSEFFGQKAAQRLTFFLFVFLVLFFAATFFLGIIKS
ncbi:MAG: ferric reductase-like transmembrane domain-containing protein [Microgenomates group bacterium]